MCLENLVKSLNFKYDSLIKYPFLDLVHRQKFENTKFWKPALLCLQTKKYLTWWTPEIELRGSPGYVFFHEDGRTTVFRNVVFLILGDGKLQKMKTVSVNHTLPSKPCCAELIQTWHATHIETDTPPSSSTSQVRRLTASSKLNFLTEFCKVYFGCVNVTWCFHFESYYVILCFGHVALLVSTISKSEVKIYTV